MSTLVLFGIAMPLKYAAGLPQAVSVVGSIHGALFVALAVMLILTAGRKLIPHHIAAWGIFAAVVPFGPFVFDRRLKQYPESQEGANP